MKNAKKLLSLLLLLCFMLPMLLSCHGSGNETEHFITPENFDTTREHEIVFWAKNDTNKTQISVYQKAIADFEAVYPNITVKMKPFTNYNDIYKEVITNIPTDTTPNVCITYPDHIATYKTGKNTIVPLDDLVKDEKYGLGGSEVAFEAPTEDEMVQKFLEEGKIGGVQYALPFMRSTEACYINRGFVEKLGYEIPDVLTWDFIFEVSAAAMEKDEDGNFKVNGQKVLLPFIYKSTDNMMIQMLKQKGAGYSTEDGKIEIFNDTTEQILYMVADAAETKSFTTFKIKGYPGNYLNAGQCIFAIDSTAGATWMGSDAPQSDISEDRIVDFETVVRPIPQFDTEHPQMISQGPSICLFNKEDPQQVLASWLFMQFLLTNDVQISYAQTEGYLPVTEKAHNSERYVDYLSRSGEDNDLYYSVKLDATKLLLDHIDDTFITPVFNGSADLRNAAGQMIEEVVKGLNRQKTIDDAFLDELYGEMTALYRLSGVRQEFDTLPMESVVLLSVLGIVWCCIGVYFLCKIVKNKRQKQKK
ncbi:MAG: extracellular solute-binding protein [Ruminococcaceae bacterium]|nr:extracellular solute-binding protein [Oscillospiraceae bacterium]